MNVGEAFKRTLGLIDEFSSNGTLRTSSEYADYRLRFNRIIDRLQKDIAMSEKISANQQYTQYPFDNMYGGDNDGFDLVQHKNAALTSVQATGARGYYFEVDNPNTVYVQEETSTGTWSTLQTVSSTSFNNTFYAYRGLITASSTANAIRLNFSGSYPYRIRNTALFQELFAGSTYVPDYRPYVKHTMPSDLMELDQIIWEEGTTYRRLPEYFWENPLTLCVKYDYSGSFTVFYWKIPTSISSDDTTPSTYDSTDLEVGSRAQEVIIYGAAAELLTVDPNAKGTSVLLRNIYNDKKSELSTSRVAPQNETIEEVFGW